MLAFGWPVATALFAEANAKFQMPVHIPSLILTCGRGGPWPNALWGASRLAETSGCGN